MDDPDWQPDSRSRCSSERKKRLEKRGKRIAKRGGKVVHSQQKLEYEAVQ